MGLNPRHLKEFQAKRIYSSVILENVPQLIIQIYFLSILGAFDEATFVALLSSSISVILSVVDIWSSKRLVTVMDDKDTGGFAVNTIEFLILSSEEIESKKRVLLTRPRALAKAIAETLIVDVRTVEVYQLLASGDGIKVGFTVYAIDYPIDAMIDKLFEENVKLKLLINNYWGLKQYPEISDFHQGQRLQNNTYQNGIEEEYDIDNDWNGLSSKHGQQDTIENANELHPNHGELMDGRDHGLSVTSIGSTSRPWKKSSFNESVPTNYVPLNRMGTIQKKEMIKNDPQLKDRTSGILSKNQLLLVSSTTTNDDDDEGEMEEDDIISPTPMSYSVSPLIMSPSGMLPIDSVSNDYEEVNTPSIASNISPWKQYMDNLQDYSQCQTQLYESHEMAKDKPLELLSDEDIDDENEGQWMDYAQNISKLLDDKSELKSRNNINDNNKGDDTNINTIKSQWNSFIENVNMSLMDKKSEDDDNYVVLDDNNDEIVVDKESQEMEMEMNNNIIVSIENDKLKEDDPMLNNEQYIE